MNVKLREGTLRAPDPSNRIRDGNHEGPVAYIQAAPGDQMYSTVAMFATEYWDGECWQLIDEEQP